MARPLLTLTVIELKLFLRNPTAAFFTLVFPLLILVVFGSIFGNRIMPGTTVGAVDVSVPGYIAMIMGTTGLMAVPGWVSTYREQGIFRRFRVTPMEPWILLVAQGIVGLLSSLFGTILLVVAARLLFHLRLPEAPLALIPAFLLGSASIYGMGAMVASLARTARSAQALGMALYFPMLFLSGATFPRQLMPPGVHGISNLLPLTHANELLAGLWLYGTWRPVSLLVLAGVLVVTGTVAARNFRWE